MFRKFRFFNALMMIVAVAGAYAAIRELPNRIERPPRSVALAYRPVALPSARSPLELVGAWEVLVNDPRVSGLSALAVDGGQFLAVTDLGTTIRFDPPSTRTPIAMILDLDEGPGPRGRKWARDAESLARDPRGRGWWIGYEQRHSLWLYDEEFRHALAAVDLDRADWANNRGAEGLLGEADSLLVVAENGREAMDVGPGGIRRAKLNSGAEVAEAARAPDGSAWVLLRTKGLKGISQAIAPLLKDGDRYRTGPGWPLPKAAFDNYEGMAIETLPSGGWRFWLVSDDGHRFMARTLLVALDLPSPPAPRHDKSPALHAGLSKNSAVLAP